MECGAESVVQRHCFVKIRIVKTVHAIYENGVFRPTEPVELPEASHVVFEPKLVTAESSAQSLDNVYALLGQRFNSGQFDVAGGMMSTSHEAGVSRHNWFDSALGRC